MSTLEDALDKALAKVFPNEQVTKQFPIKVRGRTLYVDRVLQSRKVAIEVDGRQHSEFVEHFHKDAEGFKDSKERDRLKDGMLKFLGYAVVRFKHDETITAALLRKRVLKALKA